MLPSPLSPLSPLSPQSRYRDAWTRELRLPAQDPPEPSWSELPRPPPRGLCGRYRSGSQLESANNTQSDRTERRFSGSEGNIYRLKCITTVSPGDVKIGFDWILRIFQELDHVRLKDKEEANISSLQ